MVVSPELTAAGYLEKLITRPKIADLIVIGKGNAELLELSVDNTKIFGKKIGELSPTDDYIIAAIHKNGEIKIPKDGMMLKKGDRISILAKNLMQLRQLPKSSQNKTFLIILNIYFSSTILFFLIFSSKISISIFSINISANLSIENFFISSKSSLTNPIFS